MKRSRKPTADDSPLYGKPWFLILGGPHLGRIALPGRAVRSQTERGTTIMFFSRLQRRSSTFRTAMPGLPAAPFSPASWSSLPTASVFTVSSSPSLFAQRENASRW